MNVPMPGVQERPLPMGSAVADVPSRTSPAGLHAGEAPRRARVVFGIMSAVARRDTVEQLAAALAPHSVVIHHDYSQKPDFDIRLPHVRFVPDPRKTGYGSWAWPLGVLHLLKHCLTHVEFDYFQLLSPSCLPIKPIEDFEAYVAGSDTECNVEVLAMNETDTMMSFAHRLYAPENSFGRRVLRRARGMYFGPNPGQFEAAGIAVQVRPRAAGPLSSLRARTGVTVTSLAKAGLFGIRPPEPGMQLYMGGAWFGVSRKAAEYLVMRASDPKLQAFFGSLNDVGETMFPTLLANSGFKLGPLNHYVAPYDGWHPRWLTVGELDLLEKVPAFFARKFPDDPAAEVRQRVLNRIMHSGQSSRPVHPLHG